MQGTADREGQAPEAVEYYLVIFLSQNDLSSAEYTAICKGKFVKSFAKEEEDTYA